MPTARSLRALILAPSFSLLACALVDPDVAPALAPTLVLACEHPDMWFEGPYPGPDGLLAYPAQRPHRPETLHTELARSAWHGPHDPAAQTSCADACVGTAVTGFYHRCPDDGWHIEAELTLAPARPVLDERLEPDACFPDSACAAAFAAPLGAHLRAPAGPIPLGRGQADHLGHADASLDIDLSGARVSHPLHGLAEYSAGQCDDDRCLFYLANLQLDDRGAHSRASLALPTPISAGLDRLKIDLMQPALAEYTPSTGALTFPAGALDLRIRLALHAGALAESGDRELRLRNPFPLHGRFTAGTLELTSELPLPLGTARLALKFRPRAHPPTAGFDPPTHILGGPDGLTLPRDPTVPSVLHHADDPDGDLRPLHWVVDGIPGATHIPPGEHDVELWVSDTRGALDRSPTHTITILATP